MGVQPVQPNRASNFLGPQILTLGVQIDYDVVHLRTSLVQIFVLLHLNFEEVVQIIELRRFRGAEVVQIIELKRFGGAPNGYPFAALSNAAH
jgi:hypothetical protein